MKLKAANLLELSLALAFALIVLAIGLQLIQEATDRINKAYTFQTFQQQSFQTLHRINALGNWDWESDSDIFPLLNVLNDTNSTLTKTYYSFNDPNWVTSTTPSELIKINLNESNTEKSLSLYLTTYATIDKLKGSLSTILIALKRYYALNQMYPPTQQLNYLTQANILNKLPNNPYTVEDISSSANKNITDWSYTNSNGTILIYAYTHPAIQLSL